MLAHQEARKVPGFTAKASLQSTGADGKMKEKTFTIWRKLKDDGIRFNSLTRFLTPAEVKNEAILFLENERGENDILLYLPAYQKVRRIERSQQSSSFMGSDFSYSDITTPHVDDYKYGLKKEGPCPAESAVAPIDGKPAVCYLIEGVPASDSIRERTGYARIMTSVRKDNSMVVMNENFDAAGTHVKTAILSEIEKLQDGHWFTKKISTLNKKTGGKTALQFSELKTDVKIDPSIFTQQSLAKGGKK
jgi:hypothetical protein